MSRNIQPRLVRNLSRRTFSSTFYTTPPNEPTISAANSLLNNQSPPAPPPRRKLLKFASIAALTATLGSTAYLTYAYSLDEVEQKTRDLRILSHFSVEDDASALKKFQARVYSAAMKVPIKTLELYMDIRRSIEEQVRGFTESSAEKLLPDLNPQDQDVLTLVLDLNETLVYSDWKRERGWRTFKRPGVDAFLEHLAKFYEIVVYSDQPSMYVDPVVERLDRKGCVRYRLARNATRYINGKHFRDLSKLNRNPKQILYISGHCLESCLQPENCVPIKPWKLENGDTALLDLIPFLEYVAIHRPDDIRLVLASYQGRDVASEFTERSKEMERQLEERRQRYRPFWRR